MFGFTTLLLALAVAGLAGLVPTLLLVPRASGKAVVVVGVLALAASYGLVIAGLPTVATVTINGLELYVGWAIVLGFPIAGAWRLAVSKGAAPVSEEERLERIRERAREKARRLEDGR